MDGTNFQMDLSRHSVDVTTAMWLGHAVIAAKPTGASDAVEEALREVARTHAAVVTAHQRQQVQESDDVRPLHWTLSTYWAAFIGRIDQYCVLPVETFPLVASAERLLALLAPDGNMALSLAFPACWTTLRTRLSRVDDEGLRVAMVDIAGAPFVTVTEVALDDFGRALGITEAPAAVSEDNLRELLRELMQAVSDYALQVRATVRRNQPETARAAQTALRPLDELRAMVRRRNPGSDAEGEAGDAKETTDAKEKTDAKEAAPPAPPAAPARPSAQPMNTPTVAPPN